MKAKTVKRAALTTPAMVAGNENTIEKVILDGRLREWVGIGWIDVGPASESDRAKYPRVVDR